MASDDPQYNPPDDSGTTGLTVSFRTMPKDLEILYALKKQEQTQPQQAEAIEMPYSLPHPPTIPYQQPSQPAPIIEEAPAPPLPELPKQISEEVPSPAPGKKVLAKQQIKELYQQAKSLYKRNFFQEAADKFNELLKISPYHLRARWFLSRSLNKFKKYQESYLKMHEEEEAILKQDFAEKIATEEMKKREAEEKLRAEEERLKQEAQARMQIEQRLESTQKEKSAMEEQMNRIQEALQKIKQETEERVKQEFSEKIELKEQAKKGLENQLAQLQQQKAALEAQLRQEHENLVRSKQEAQSFQISQLANQELLRKEEIRAQEAARKRMQEMAEQQERVRRAMAWQTQVTQEPAPARTNIFDYLFLSKITKTIGVLVATAAVAGIFIYFVGLWSKETAEPKPQPQQSQLILPAPLFQVDKIEIITLAVGQKKNLVQELDRLTTKDLAAGNFVQVIVKITSQDEQKYASLTEFVDSAQLAFPAEVLNNLSKDYTVFIYSHKELPLSPFSIGLGKNKIGIVAATSDEKNISQNMKTWEKNMARDLEAMFLGKKISFSTDYQFEEIMYSGFLIRSLNLPNQYSSLNYTFYKGKLVITTSLESIKALIDRMAPQ